MKVYLDNIAAKPVDPRVVQAMQPYLQEIFGNPSSLHSWGRQAQAGLNKARGQVAALVGAQPEEIIFTSSGSEANNLALKGLLAASKKKHLIVSAIEHFSVLQIAKRLEKQGYQVTYLPVNEYGQVSLDELKKAINSETALVSIQHANSEVGTIQPIAEIGAICRQQGVIFHTDAVVTAGLLPLNVRQFSVDALTLTANQFYGPLGAAALYVRKGVRLQPQIEGGIQENGRRAGTENVAAVVGMGKAAEIAAKEKDIWAEKLTVLRDKLITGLLSVIPNARLNGHPALRLPDNVNIGIEFIEGESMLLMLDMAGVAASSGSACTSRALKASHVLKAMGVPHEKIHGSLLFTLGKQNSDEEINYVLKTLPPIVERLRAMSPLAAADIRKGA